MNASARNQLEGTISAVNPGPVSTEVVLDLAGGDKLVAVVTTGSAQMLGLKPGSRAVGLVKAPSVMLVTDAAQYRFSARNQFSGRVTDVTKGAVNSEVAIRLSGGTVIYAIVTNEAVGDLQCPSDCRRAGNEAQARQEIRRGWFAHGHMSRTNSCASPAGSEYLPCGRSSGRAAILSSSAVYASGS